MATDKTPEYQVYVDDNFHYMDEGERYSGGVFDSWEAAEAKCRGIVDEFLVANYKEGMAADELLRHYKSYGDTPHNDATRFVAAGERARSVSS
jgi:hypothetical protein